MIAGENGRRSGLAVAACGSVEVRVLVLPKMWRATQQGKCQRPTIARETLANGRVSVSIVSHEGDEFALTPGIVPDAEWVDITNCCELIAERAENLASITKGERKGHRRSALVRPSSKRHLDTPERVQGGDTRITDAWRQFLSLWNRVPENLRRPRSPAGLFGDVSSLESLDSLLAPLVKREYVRRVARVIHHARPGYTRVTRGSRFIRGSMNIASAAIALQGGRDTVVCTYDAFGLDTPLLRVIASALRVVAEGDATGDLPTAPEAIADARWLLNKLAAVQYLPRVAAARLGRSLLPRLPRLDSAWLQAMRLACLVLDATGIEPITGPEDSAIGWHDEQAPCYVFDVNTASLWEWMVRKAWPSCTDCKKGARRWAWRPKDKQRGMQVDIDTGHGEIADAKYKDWQPIPPAADKRQAFTYSHLYKATRVLWVYAAPCASPCHSGNTLIRRGSRRKPVTLQSIAAAFPSPEDAEDDDSWHTYVGELSAQLSAACLGKCP